VGGGLGGVGAGGLGDSRVLKKGMGVEVQLVGRKKVGGWGGGWREWVAGADWAGRTASNAYNVVYYRSFEATVRQQ